ncbi:MAG: dihydrodipicolinate synthase family protein [Clostridia bacterium]|nr:dihydrodipicolinate synthase family protein [Clostridia bacterium]
MMYDTSKFRGIFVAFNSLFDSEDKVYISSIKKLVRKYRETGVTGLYLCGSTGEGIMMSVEERKQLTEAVMEEVGGEMVIIVHVGACATKDAVELAKHTQQVGADAVSAVPSIYYRLPEESIKLNWDMISEAADLPFFIYNIPALTGYNLTLDLFKKMLQNPRVCGIKNSSDSSWQIERFKTIGGKDFVVFNGPDEQYLGGRMLGADAGIGGTYGAMPELYVHLESLIQKGDMKNARIWQQRINECIFALLDCPSLYGASKGVIFHRYSIDCGQPRKPLLPVDPNSEKVLHATKLIENYVSMI